MPAESMPLVSVIVTNYNYLNYIAETIESITNQTYSNLEIVIIDDGSNDGSDRVIRSYAKNDKRIKAIFQKNKGAVHARNAGIEKSSGEYIIFIDADDTIPHTFVQGMYDVASNKAAEVVYCDLEMFGEVDGLLKVKSQSVQGLKSFSPTPICQLVKKSAIGSVRFDPYLNKLAHEDNDFFFSLYASGAKFAKSSERYNYRIHTSSRNPGSGHRKHYDAMVYIFVKHSRQYPELLSALVDLYMQKDDEVADWHKVADERLALIDSMNRKISNIEKSKAYRASRILVRPVNFIKSLARGNK